YPQYMTEADPEEVQDPHNFALELWATCGFFGMAALLVALAVFFRRALRAPAVPEPESEPQMEQRTPWEFYLGGMAGLILGFFLVVWHLSVDEMLVAVLPSLIRSLVWFPAFALFLNIRWTGPSRTLALVAGIAVLLLNLCISGGIGLPAVATSLWTVI